MDRSPDRPDPPLPADAPLQRSWRGGRLGRLVLVASGDLDGDGRAEIAALAGRELKVFDWNGSTYALAHELSLVRDGLSLALGRLGPDGPPAIAIGCRDAVMLLAVSAGAAANEGGAGDHGEAGDEGGLRPLSETLLYPNAFFRSVSLADINGDGHTEVVAAASGAQTLYVFQVLTDGGGVRLEELGRVYIGGLVSAQGAAGEVAVGTREGHVDVFVPCSLLPQPVQAIYSVKRGDSLWRIARKFGVSPGAMARANRLREPYQLTAGQILVIPPPRKEAGGSRH